MVIQFVRVVLGTMGYIASEIAGKVPDYLLPSMGIKFPDVPFLTTMGDSTHEVTDKVLCYLLPCMDIKLVGVILLATIAASQ